MIFRLAAVVAASLCLLGEAHAGPPALRDAPAVYRVRPGDTLFDLAVAHLKHPGDYAAVQRLNRVADPRRLAVGSTLTIPYRLLRTEPVSAKLVAFRGPVTVTIGGARVTPQKGMELSEGAVLETGSGAFLTLQIADGSRTTLPSHSRLRIQRLRLVPLTGEIDRVFLLEEGRSASKVNPLKSPGDRFMIRTPLAVAAVRGTEFRIAHLPNDARSALEVVEGRVANQASSGDTVLAESGSGVVTGRDGASAPLALLAPPKLLRSGAPQDDPGLRFEVEPAEGAQLYRAQIAMDAGFIDILSETESPSPALVFDGVPDGTYFVRLTALDRNGLEGLPAVYSFERRLNSLRTEPPRELEGAKRRYLFRWDSAGAGEGRYRFQLARQPDGSGAVIDEAGLSDDSIVVTDLPPGVYYWRVMVSRRQDDRTIARWSTAQRFEIGG